MHKSIFIPILLALLCGAAIGQEWHDYAQSWLNEDYYGAPYNFNGNTYYGYIPLGFTDPVFVPYGQTNYTQWYPYFGEDFFTYGLSPSLINQSMYVTPFYTLPNYNSPRYRSDLYWQSPLSQPQNQTNWTQTVSLAKSQSSLRVYRNGQWVVP